MRREEIYANRYLAGLVKRYSTWPVLAPESVAEHCCRVAQIYVEIFGMPRAEVLYYILHHDSGELWAGDIPFGVKKASPGLKEAMDAAETNGLKMLGITLPILEEQERFQVKIADVLQMHEKGSHEYDLGNKYALPIKQDTVTMAQRLASECCVSDLVNHWLGDWQGRRVRHG